MPIPTSPLQDRLDALRRMAPGDIAALLRRVPTLADALAGRGQLASLGMWALRPYGVSSPDLRGLSALVSSSAGIDLTLASLNRFELQLATLAVWHGGQLTRAQALAETGAAGEPGLDEAAGVLARLLVSNPDAGWVALRPGVAEVVGLPGVPIRPHLMRLGSDEIAGLLVRLSGDAPPVRKDQRINELEARLRERATVEASLAGVSEEARRVFSLLASHGPQRLRDLGISPYTRHLRQGTPLHDLALRGLAGFDREEELAWVWLDVLVGLNGRLFGDWRPPPAGLATGPLHGAGAGLPPVLGRLDALLDAWGAEPAPALATGGLGVRTIRAAAKQLGMAPGEAGLLAHLAHRIELLGRKPVRGRATSPAVWAPTELAAGWRRLPHARRWAVLVQAWRDDPTLDERGGLPERVDPTHWGAGGGLSREALLALLGDLPDGRGAEQERLAELAAFTRPALLAGRTFDGLVAAARVLGLVPATGPVGLTPAARALLQGPDALEAALPPPRTEFTVQADHSVVAPPDLCPDVASRLGRYAELESDAGAMLYRLSERRIAGALDAGERPEGILAFLTEHATAALPQNVAYLVGDVARRHGRVRAGACASYLRCDDPALLTRATAVKAAKLRQLAPTVAVSALSRDRLVVALRVKGLMPVAEGADGAALPTSRTVVQQEDAFNLRELPEPRPARSAEEFDALAKALLDSPADEFAPRRRRR